MDDGQLFNTKEVKVHPTLCGTDLAGQSLALLNYESAGQLKEPSNGHLPDQTSARQEATSTESDGTTPEFNYPTHEYFEDMERSRTQFYTDFLEAEQRALLSKLQAQ